ncbi:MAG: 30S ribosomal protein S5 [Candidatus Niyogibacteria bacterium]|nr:30S ribosomal protein S5 [Candidatus Niyogibacteria bacterium]
MPEAKKPFPKKNFPPRPGGQRPGGFGGRPGAGKGGRPGSGPRRDRPERERPEFDQKMIDLRRVARVVSGGRRFAFRATLVIGDRNGRVGLGLGKAADTTAAIEKAYNQAKKHILRVPLTKTGSIPHESLGKYGSGLVLIRPAAIGRGLVAGTSARVVLDLAGVKNATSKVLSRTKNKLNNARATLAALENLRA